MNPGDTTVGRSPFLTHPSIPSTLAAAELHAAIMGALFMLDANGNPLGRALNLIADQHGPSNLIRGQVAAGDAICRECAAPLGPNDYAAGDVNAAYPCFTTTGIAVALGIELPPRSEWYDDVIALMPADGPVRGRLRLVR